MSSREGQIGLVIVGSVFLGIWLYGMLFSFNPSNAEPQDVGRWGGWGLLGMVIAAAGYGTRALEGLTQIISIVVLVMVTTLAVMGALLNANEYILATLCTAIGLSMVLAALPAPKIGAVAEWPTQEAAEHQK